MVSLKFKGREQTARYRMLERIRSGHISCSVFTFKRSFMISPLRKVCFSSVSTQFSQRHFLRANQWFYRQIFSSKIGLHYNAKCSWPSAALACIARNFSLLYFQLMSLVWTEADSIVLYTCFVVYILSTSILVWQFSNTIAVGRVNL